MRTTCSGLNLTTAMSHLLQTYLSTCQTPASHNNKVSP